MSFNGRSPKDKLNPHSPRVVNDHNVHPHPTRRDVTVHMIAMMPIHISNFNGSHTIIFHIIQTIMLTHQLACINIASPTYISSHSIKEITILSSTHHSCFSCQATTCKQFHMDHFDPTSNLNCFFYNPKTVRGLSMNSPLIKHRLHFLEMKSLSISGLSTLKTIFMAF